MAFDSLLPSKCHPKCPLLFMLKKKYASVKAKIVPGNVEQARKTLFKAITMREVYQNSELISTEVKWQEFLRAGLGRFQGIHIC